MGMKLAQVALSYGADDLHGTIIEDISSTWPVQLNTFYEPIKVWETSQSTTAESEPTSNKSKVLEDNLATA